MGRCQVPSEDTNERKVNFCYFYIRELLYNGGLKGYVVGSIVDDGKRRDDGCNCIVRVLSFGVNIEVFFF